jgi:hypothetical protein
LQLLPGATPGLANPNLPAGTVPALPPVDLGGEGDDSVLIPVIADWSGIANARPTLYVGKVAALANLSIVAYGYGMTGNDAGCQSNANTTGAGTARSGMFTVTSPATWGDGESWSYQPSSTAGAVLTCGDSGGPDEFVPNFFYVSHVITGVHSTPTRTIAINMQAQRALGGLYLSPLANPNYDLGVDANNTIIFYQRGDLRRGAIMYDAATQRLTLNGLCLSWGFSTTNGVLTFMPVPQTCDATNPGQKWDIGPSLQIRNVALNRCWSSTAPGNLTLATCGGPSLFTLAPVEQQWVMSAQP